MTDHFKTHAGYVAILGRPNVGKSTLLNKILGKKISITARKAQTTRHKILGIKTEGDYQAIYVDTPGIHSRSESPLNTYMNKAALSTLNDVDAIIFMVAGTAWHTEDEFILRALSKVKCPVILVINKVDLIPQKSLLLGHIKTASEKFNFQAVVPLSAQEDTNLDSLEEVVKKLLPENPFFFPKEQATDRDDKFLAAEIIREKLTRFLGQELPYALSVMIDNIELKKEVMFVTATIYVERQGQKVIIIGKDGEVLKKIGTLARHDMETLFSRKVFLRLWIKVKANWTSDDKLLSYLGYRE
ncbi:MAG: GTPase Era [Gammaproteobacteria bacterium]|nr:GTPase Era [Gammaproteobacteria bacterium]